MRDAFVEVQADTAHDSILPLVSWSPSYPLTTNPWGELGNIWRDPAHPYYTRDNHIQLLGAENWKKNDTNWAGATPADYGAGRQLFSGVSVVFVQSLEMNSKPYKQYQVDITSMHELTHNCAVYCFVSSPNIYHCTNNAYTPPNDGMGCYMHAEPAGIVPDLPRPCLNHILTGGGGIEYIDTSIRDQVDPIP